MITSAHSPSRIWSMTHYLGGSITIYFLSAHLVFAAEPTTFRGLVGTILELINIIIPAIFGLVFVYIIWKVIDAWVINGADPSKRQEGRQLLILAVVVFVLMLITWGIVALLRNAFFG
jgi:hypothetical protein